MTNRKKDYCVDNLAIFGAAPAFSAPRPNSGLYQPDRERFLKYCKQVFANRHVTNNGPMVRDLEVRLAKMHGTEFCVSCCSGFMTLVLAITALVLPGKEHVIMPTATYRKMTDIVRWAGKTPFFVDVDITTLGMTPELVAPYVDDSTALVLAAHPMVNVSDLPGLEKLCADNGVPLLIDSVEVAYGEAFGRKIGSFGDAEVFSVHASKFLNGFEGGYLTTNDEELALKVRRLRAFGFMGKDNIVDLGCNAKLNEIHAAMVLSCLDEVDMQIDANRKIYEVYNAALSDLPLSLIEYQQNVCTWKNIVIRLESEWPFSAQQTLNLLNKENMLSRGYYSPLLHTDSAASGFMRAPLDNSVAISQSHIVLPSGHHVSSDDAREVVRFLQYLFADSIGVLSALEA